jgi:hypothetical protein
MGSSGKKKTTMAKLARENRLRERRLTKQAKKDARKQASPDHMDTGESPPEEGTAQSTPQGALAAAGRPFVQLPATGDREDGRGEAASGSTGEELPVGLARVDGDPSTPAT